MKWFVNCKSLEELKKTYKELVLKYHPDRGGDNATMAQINAEYDKVFESLKHVSTSKTEQAENVNEYRDIINALLNLKGLQVEICGCWLWVSGNTYANREALKKLDFQWSKNKQMWYWRPAEAAQCHNSKPQSIDEIRSKYGSTIIIAKAPGMLAGN